MVIHSTRPAFEKSADGHQHQAYGAVAAGEGAEATSQAVLDYVGVYGIENDHGFVAHAQGGSGVDPVTFPAGGAQRLVDFRGVLAALATDQDVAGSKFTDILRVFERAVPDSSGAAPAMLDVEKKTGSRPAKSFSSRILCMRTLPTMPRHPINPTLGVAKLSRTVWLIMPLLKGFSRGVLANAFVELEFAMNNGKR